jgi:hypothetical protein
MNTITIVKHTETWESKQFPGKRNYTTNFIAHQQGKVIAKHSDWATFIELLKPYGPCT